MLEAENARRILLGSMELKQGLKQGTLYQANILLYAPWSASHEQPGCCSACPPVFERVDLCEGQEYCLMNVMERKDEQEFCSH